ncbi:MAG: hypothetical protein ABIF77_13030, partial [bacterium]
DAQKGGQDKMGRVHEEEDAGTVLSFLEFGLKHLVMELLLSVHVGFRGKGGHPSRLHPEALEEGTNLSGVAPNPRHFGYLFSGFGHSDRRMLQKNGSSR